MYYQNYEEYMQDVLGYPNRNIPTYNGYGEYNSTQNRNREIETLYPDIYKIVYPMVCKVCDRNTKPLTREVLETMVEEIYMNIETEEIPDEGANVKIEVRNSSGSRSSSSSNTRNREESRQNCKGNCLLKDLIRVLLLREFLARPMTRPPMPRPPYMPPYPGRPDMRPPMPREDYNMYY